MFPVRGGGGGCGGTNPPSSDLSVSDFGYTTDYSSGIDTSQYANSGALDNQGSWNDTGGFNFNFSNGVGISGQFSDPSYSGNNTYSADGVQIDFTNHPTPPTDTAGTIVGGYPITGKWDTNTGDPFTISVVNNLIAMRPLAICAGYNLIGSIDVAGIIVATRLTAVGAMGTGGPAAGAAAWVAGGWATQGIIDTVIQHAPANCPI